jgi:fructose-1,6-bisphosphatase I
MSTGNQSAGEGGAALDPGVPLIITAEQHILQEQQTYFPEADATFSSLLSSITLATKMIQAKVRSAGLQEILGSAGEKNVQGEVQQKLDVYANQALLHCLGLGGSVAILVSEENEEPVTFDRAPETGKYVVFFDPLDGSSNIDVNVSVGTIFSVFRRPDNSESNRHEFGAGISSAILQPGSQQIAAGYVVYGSSTMLVYTTGKGVFGFTLDPGVGAYVLSHDRLRMPNQGTTYSVNEAQASTFPAEYQDYLTRLRSGATGREYSSRYVGSLVADFHRTLLKGGVFLYPPTRIYPNGKLRLLYEANPLAFIAEQAGGLAIDGQQRILEIEPREIHQRTPLVFGSQAEVEEFQQSCKLVAAGTPGH